MNPEDREPTGRVGEYRHRTERAGRALGNWNDRRVNGDTPAERGRLWRVLDRLAGWLYVRSER